MDSCNMFNLQQTQLQQQEQRQIQQNCNGDDRLVLEDYSLKKKTIAQVQNSSIRSNKQVTSAPSISSHRKHMFSPSAHETYIKKQHIHHDQGTPFLPTVQKSRYQSVGQSSFGYKHSASVTTPSLFGLADNQLRYIGLHPSRQKEQEKDMNEPLENFIVKTIQEDKRNKTEDQIQQKGIQYFNQSSSLGHQFDNSSSNSGKSKQLEFLEMIDEKEFMVSKDNIIIASTSNIGGKPTEISKIKTLNKFSDLVKYFQYSQLRPGLSSAAFQQIFSIGFKNEAISSMSKLKCIKIEMKESRAITTVVHSTKVRVKAPMLLNVFHNPENDPRLSRMQTIIIL